MHRRELLKRLSVLTGGSMSLACQRALAYDTPKYRTVKTILDNGLDQQPDSTPADDDLADCYTGGGRFCRDTAKLFTH